MGKPARLSVGQEIKKATFKSISTFTNTTIDDGAAYAVLHTHFYAHGAALSLRYLHRGVFTAAL